MSEKSHILSSESKGKLMSEGKAYEFYFEDRPPCALACPAGVDIKAYVNLVADKRYEEAVGVIRQTNPFPGICGRVCTHPCEADCGRNDIDDAVSIRALKRFAADYELSRKGRMDEAPRRYEKSIAIIGSGPAGLTAAADLASAGFPVTVFEEGESAGGLMSWGIPDFRLPKSILKSEIKDIIDLGVEIRTNERVDDPKQLLEEGYSAVILAMGCQAPVKLELEGMDSPAIVDCLQFLREASGGRDMELGKTMVIGGGNAALDSARTAVRLGAEVTVAYRRTEEQMPAEREEIQHAKEEGIDFQFLAIPHEVIVKDGKLRGMKFQRAELGEPDGSGRRRPVPIPDDFFTVDADNMILALGSRPDTGKLPHGLLRFTRWSAPETDENGMTSHEGIFAAGDIVSGPSSIVRAIGSGHCAANGVMEYLAGDEGRFGPVEFEPMLIVEAPEPEECRRVEPGCLEPGVRQTTFDEVEMCMGEQDAIAEANRCRRCGSCHVCSVCLAVCDYRNAAITVKETGEKAVAKVPFQVAGGDWKLVTDAEEANVRVEPILASVDEDICIACGRCEESCPYKAIRTVFDAGGKAHAVVDQGACRGCGACAGTCPSGAIKMGWTGNDTLFPLVHEAVGDSGDGVVKLSCIWHDTARGIGHEPGEVKLQCTRRASPALILEALASGARGVEVFGCADDECHYLPGPWMGPDVVESCRTVLEAVGMDPGRVVYSDSENEQKVPGGPGALQSNTDKIQDIKPPMGRALNAAQVLMAQPDRVPQMQAEGKYLLGMGCLAMSEPVFAAHGFERPDILGAVKKLLDAAGVDYEPAPGIHISGSSLREWGMEALYDEYSESIIRQVKESQAEGLIIPTPKTYRAFDDEYGEVFEVLALPEMLNGINFINTDMTVAYHRSCADGGDFDRQCLELLSRIPGLKVVELEGECGDTGWRLVGSGSRDRGSALMKQAEDAGADVLISSSTRCIAHLDALRNGWCQSAIEVMDVFRFLADLLEVEEDD